MAVFSMSDMGASMSTVYRRKISQTQRKTPTLRVLAALGAFKRANTGSAINWTPKFSGQNAGNANLDGGAFLSASSDQPAPASIGFGTYEAPAKVTDDILWRGGVAAGIPAEFNTFSNLFQEAMIDAVEASIKLMNQQLYTGTGLTNQMTGMSTAVASSGTYAGVAAATYSQWASTVTINGGVLRSLSLPLLKTFLRTIAVAAKSARPNLILAPPAIMDAVEELFMPYLQFPQAMAPIGSMARERVVMNPGKITTVGGNINMDGFRHMHWATAGVCFVEDPDCSNSALANTTNCLYAINTDEVELDYLDPPGPRIAAPDASQIAAVEQDMGPLGGLSFEAIARGRVEHSSVWDVTSKAGLALLSRNAHGCLGDIQ